MYLDNWASVYGYYCNMIQGIEFHATIRCLSILKFVVVVFSLVLDVKCFGVAGVNYCVDFLENVFAIRVSSGKSKEVS